MSLKRQYVAQKQQVQQLQEQLTSAQQQADDAVADRKDALRLVDVMSASPAGIKSVLEAYLKKLGDSTGSVPVKFGIGADGRQLPISERISIALQLKREQERALGSTGRFRQEQSPAASRSSSKAVAEKVELLFGSSSKSKKLNRASRDAATAPVKSVSDIRRESLSRASLGTAPFGGEDGEEEGEEEGGERQEEEGQEERERGFFGSDGNADDKEDEFDQLNESTASQAQRRKKQQRAPIQKSNSGAAAASTSSSVEPLTAGGQAVAASGLASDWVECLDPRSKRKYYYSAMQRKSTWVKPANFEELQQERAAAQQSLSAAVNGSSAATTTTYPSRYASPSVPSRLAGTLSSLAASVAQQRVDPERATSTASASSQYRRTTKDEAGSELDGEGSIGGDYDFDRRNDFTSDSNAAEYNSIFQSGPKIVRAGK
jgi:hypothetical protein